MAPNRRHTLGIAGLLVCALALVAGPTLFLACQPPVSDEAMVSVSGRVLNVDGSPMANVTVRLVKTDTNILGADWVVGHIANMDKQPFREMDTDVNGEYYVEFTGAQANAGNQAWAAYFVAYVIYPDDPDGHMAVASDTFSFSNQKLDVALPDLQFWDIPANGITIGDEELTVEFTASRVAPEEGRYILHIEGSEWTAEVDGTSATVPLTALEPCLEPVVEDPSECVPKTQHRIQIISLAPGVRSRTAWHVIEAENPRGMGLWYRNDDNTSGRTCSGLNLFDLNDGKFSGKNSIQVLDQGMTFEDFRCLAIDLQEATKVEEIYLHNGAVWFHKNARIKFLATSEEEPGEDDWAEIHEFDGNGNVYPMVNLRIADITAPVRHLRIEFVDVNDGAVWQRIGEISIYGTPVATQ